MPTCAFIKCPASTTGRHAAPCIMFPSKMVYRRVENVVNQSFHNQSSHSLLVFHQYKAFVPNTPAEFPIHEPLRVTALRTLLSRKRVEGAANGRRNPSRSPQAPPSANPPARCQNEPSQMEPRFATHRSDKLFQFHNRGHLPSLCLEVLSVLPGVRSFCHLQV